MSVLTISKNNAQLQGIRYVTLGLTLFSLQDVIIKQISGGYPVQQIVFIRSIIALLLLLGIAARSQAGITGLKTQRLGLHTLRGLLLILSFTSYYLAIAALPLAEAVALYFVSPIFTAILSVLILKEVFKRQHFIALALGFGGTLVMLRPGIAIIEPAAALAILAALAYACSVMITRRMATTESGLSMAIYATLAYFVVNGLVGLIWSDGIATTAAHPSIQFLTRPWIMPTMYDLFLLSITGVIAAAGFYLLSEAYRVSEAIVIAPFEYLMLLLSIVWGYLFWGELPDTFVIIGVAMIVVGGFMLLPNRPRRKRWLLRRSG